MMGTHAFWSYVQHRHDMQYPDAELRRKGMAFHPSRHDIATTRRACLDLRNVASMRRVRRAHQSDMVAIGIDDDGVA